MRFRFQDLEVDDLAEGREDQSSASQSLLIAVGIGDSGSLGMRLGNGSIVNTRQCHGGSNVAIM